MIRTCLIKCECVCGALFYVYILTVWNEEGSEKLLGALQRKFYRVFICLYLLSIWRVSLVQHAVNVKYPSVCEAPCHVKAILSGNLRADSNLIRGTACICYTVKEGNKGWIKKWRRIRWSSDCDIDPIKTLWLLMCCPLISADWIHHTQTCRLIN